MPQPHAFELECFLLLYLLTVYFKITTVISLTNALDYPSPFPRTITPKLTINSHSLFIILQIIVVIPILNGMLPQCLPYTSFEGNFKLKVNWMGLLKLELGFNSR